ncbi:hypothetical protein [Natrinema sp. DC36]|uniref:DUF7260 family protein n=1 Tax=Natrinema sp. DC36 TaxID=2878680 RepID=UPI001CF014AC|nr:hypothetical protein [Natrinema sp. DC36]
MTTSASLPAGVDHPPTGGNSTRNVVVLGLAAAALLAIAGGVIPTGRSWAASPGTGAVLSTVIVGHIPAAITAIEREVEQLERECDAFDRFATEVKSITVSAGGTERVSPLLASTATANRSELGEVRTAYRNTVMEVDHFELEYGEGLRENMHLELTGNVAAAVVDGYQFSEPLKQAVIQQSILARSRRESLIQTIDIERDSLERNRDRIREIEDGLETEPAPSTLSITELFGRDRLLRRRLARYEQLIRERQRCIHSNDDSRADPTQPFLQAYLYDSLEFDFPVLATVTERYERLRERQRAVHRKIL